MSRLSDFLVVSAVFGALVTPVLAQETAENAPQEAASAESAPAEKAAPLVPEIVVTAQKRAESLYEVPLSVSAIGRDALAERNVEKLDDIGQLTPNVDIAALPRSTYVRIRGLGSGDNKGFEQSIGLFVDGIYQGRAEYLNDAMLDIEQIEVLRGPQGTLFGKNTVAGALNITTANPGDDFEVWGSGLFGEYSQMRFQGAVNVPVIEDAVNIRLAGKRNLRDGFVYNRKLDRDEANIDKYYFRGKASLVAIENLEVIAGFDISKIKGRGNGYQLSTLAEPATTLYTLFDADIETDVTDFETSLDYPGFVKRDTQAATLTANWDVWDHTLTLVGGWSSYTFEVSDDVDFGPAPLLSFLYDDEYDQYSAELRIVSPKKRLSYVAGAYWFRSDYRAMTDFTMLPNFNALDVATQNLLPGALGAALGPLGAMLPVGFTGDNRHKEFNQVTDHYAAYAQADFEVFDWLTIIGGLRLSHEKKSHDQEQTFLNGGVPFMLITGDEAFAAQQDIKETDLAPKISAKFDITDEIMTYVTWAKGFKGGGFNEMATSPSDLGFTSERSNTLEGGAKARLLGGRVAANIAYFYTNFENLQVAVWDGTGFIVTNAEEATTQGIEFETTVVPFAGLTFNGGAGWIDASYDKFTNGPCLAGEGKGCDLSGDRLNQAPEWNATFSAQYETPVFSLPFEAFIGGDVYWQTHMFLTPDLDPLDSQGEYTLFSARAGLRDENGNWTFTVRGRNLTDEAIKQESFDVPLFQGSHFAVVAPARMISAEFEAKF